MDYTNNQPTRDLSNVDKANLALLKLQSLADLFSSTDPIQLDSRTLEGTALIIIDCIESLRMAINNILEVTLIDEVES